MPAVTEPLPYSPTEAVIEILHGVAVTDPYRWLEDQESPRTREWISAQTRYARAYLDSIPHRERISNRIRELLDVETCDSLQKVGNRYFFRKRLPGQEQPSIFMREGMDGPDQVLVDPSLRGTGPHTAVKPLRASLNGRILLYEVKQSGERNGTFELLDIETREALPEIFPRGYLCGFAFAHDSTALYYVHEAPGAQNSRSRVAYRHVLGTTLANDKAVFTTRSSGKLRLQIIPGQDHLGFLVINFDDETTTDFYLWNTESGQEPQLLIGNVRYSFGPLLLGNGRVLALTDHEAPNQRIVELCYGTGQQPTFFDIVPTTDVPIQNWLVCGDRIFVSYLHQLQTEIQIFDFNGKQLGHLPLATRETVRLIGRSESGDELFLEQESFTQPVHISVYRHGDSKMMFWAKRQIPFDHDSFCHIGVTFPAKDGTRIPMFLVGQPRVLEGGPHPIVMTSYGGYGVPMTPQFSVFVTFLLERGCLFALPNIRGGSEFGTEWHEAAKRRKRQVAFDDFIAAAEWLIETKRTNRLKLAIFGGSNSGLLVAACMTQRPDLFRAVVCMVPMLDMLRYHLFDNAHIWREEFGTSDDPEDFVALRRYSPYHNIHDGTAYPAVMFVSGDSDQTCNPLHARKMTARLQAASSSLSRIFLDYSRYRGHSPVLPLTDRINALTDRMAFLCDQLQLSL